MADGNKLWPAPRAAYIHVPFCAHRCSYCDFAIAVGRDDMMDRYLDSLAAELATLVTPRPVDTLFIGGGTPTYLNVGQLQRLLSNVTRWFTLQPGHEFSIEANPGTLNADKVAVLAGYGVTRASLGVQSFQPAHLRVLERDHPPEDVPRAIEAVREHIPEISLDLIFGVPGQTLAAWDVDLRQALEIRPDHISTYGLTYEKGTPLWKRQQQGAIHSLDEESELALYAYAIDRLEAAGFEHYEISNFALPGKRSRHNQVYWANEPHFGFGMGAARYVDGRRELNTRDLTTYIRKALAGESTVFQSESLQSEERARETMAMQLRRSEGINRASFRWQTDFDLDALTGEAITRHVDLGLLADNGNRVCLTRQGKYVADTIITALLG
jgi:oxygen-independent coproporphyrinogen-3 oxidase